MHSIKLSLSRILTALIGITLFITVPAQAVLLSNGDTATVQIYAQPDTNAVSEALQVLQTYLGQMTGAEFSCATTPYAGKGILLAVGSDAAALPPATAEALKTMGGEGYVVFADRDKLILAGNSGRAVRHATYELLGQLGCRWLVPSERWTIVPKRSKLKVEPLQIATEPDIANRSIWYAYGMGVDDSRYVLARDYNRWVEGNRLGGLAPYKCGHTYPHTVEGHKDLFQAHPEYFAMKEDGTRIPYGKYHSLCYSNPDVASIFIEEKVAELRASKAANPYAYTVSMDPNDGSVACCCESCKALGNGSDQALYLLNQVAKALRKEFPDGVATMYVYASHRLPPLKVKSEPNASVQVAMGFNRTKYSLDELVAEWRKNVPSVGIRDYFGVMAWDWGLPGRGKASSINYMKTWLPKFKRWNAASFNAECNVNWASFGPATYVATKLLWDASTDADAAYAEFFVSAFGAGAADMKALHALWATNSRLSVQNMHEWFALLENAFKAARNDGPGVQQRLIDMAAYLHYVRLYHDWECAVAGGDRDEAYTVLKPLLEFTWRIRERQMVHSYALQRRLVNAGAKILRPLEAGWRFNEKDAVWKNPESLTDTELLEIFKADLASTPPDKRIRTFSTNLKKLDAEGGTPAPVGVLRGRSRWHVLVERDEHLAFPLKMTGVRYPYILTIHDTNGKQVWESKHTVSADERYEQKLFELDVKFPKTGQYIITIQAGEDYRPMFPEGLRVVLEASDAHHPLFRMYGNAYFYVPKGTKRILMKTEGRVALIRPGETLRTDYEVKDEDPKLQCTVIPVEDDAGEVWTLSSQTAGNAYFLNIPPYIASSPDRLLVPAEAMK